MKNMMNFVEGVGNLLNIIPTIESPKIQLISSSFHDDYNKLTGDWQNVGNDIKQAMNKYDTSTPI